MDEALVLLSNYWAAMKSWDERAAVLWEDKENPRREELKDQVVRELNDIHRKYCLPTEETEYFVVCTPSYFDFDLLEVVQKTRNRLIVHVAHKNQAVYPYRFQFEVRRKDGQWKVAAMWQTLASGKRIRCPY